MRKTAITLILLSLVLVCVQPVDGQYSGDITINVDGSLSPLTAPIQRTGSVYSLTSDLNGSIMVNGNDLVLDGNGHTLAGISLQGTSNVTVKNFSVTSRSYKDTIGIFLNSSSNNLVVNNTVQGFWSVYALNGISIAGIYVRDGNSNVISQNNLEGNLVGLDIIKTSYNLIVQNNITSNALWSPYTTGIYFVGASNNTIYHNNIVNNKYLAQVSNSQNTWDNGYPSGGNYWGDYQTKYSNATTIDISGIGDTAYLIDAQNLDKYPFMEPISAGHLPENSPTLSAATPSPDITQSPVLSHSPSVPEFPTETTAIILALSAVTALALLFTAKRRRPQVGFAFKDCWLKNELFICMYACKQTG
jgi:parallel beta-helix repeat protein